MSFENLTFGCRPLGCGGKATSAAATIASESRTRRSQRTQHVEKQHAREPGDFSGVPLYRGPVREGVSRTPDMHAVEGSDRAVVPMKLPNKEVLAASAEVVEGRARTKENVAELYTSPTQSGEVRVPGVTRRARSGNSLRRHHPR